MLEHQPVWALSLVGLRAQLPLTEHVFELWMAENNTAVIMNFVPKRRGRVQSDSLLLLRQPRRHAVSDRCCASREDEVDGEAESAGVSGSGIKLVGLMFKLDPSSSETPQRPELSSTPLPTLPSLPLCCYAWTKPATRTRWPMLCDISRQKYHVVNWHVNAKCVWLPV